MDGLNSWWKQALVVLVVIVCAPFIWVREKWRKTNDLQYKFYARNLIRLHGEVYDSFEESGLSVTELAERMGKSKKWVREFLDPSSPKIYTLRNISDFALALDYDLKIEIFEWRK